MVAVTTTERPPRPEHKTAALAPAPAPAVSTGDDTGPVKVDPARGTATVIAAVTGTVDEVGDRIIPGAFTRTLRSRTPKVCRSHDWATPIGRVTSIKELLPGDPRLPARTGSGRPWSREAGALIADVQLNTAIKEGKDTLSMIQFYGPGESAWSIGYRTVKSRQRDGVRELLDVDLFEISPVLHGAHPDARLIGVKAGRPGGIEVKSTGGAARRMFRAVACAVCGNPTAAGVTGGTLPSGHRLVCGSCLAAIEKIGVESGYLDADDLAAAAAVGDEPELTSEELYAAALDSEIGWDLEDDGTLTRSDANHRATQGRAWRGR
jgi:phage head maturation protease